MRNILDALVFTVFVVLSIVLTIAVLYISLWLVVGVAIVTTFLLIYNGLKAKARLE